MNKFDYESSKYLNREQGFTLFELLVVIFILGILAAIALPTFLNQVNKAKGVEAINKINYFNKLQESYYTENSAFTDSINNLNNSSTETENYHYWILLFNQGQIAIHVAQPKKPSLSYYGGGVYLKNDSNQNKRIYPCGPLNFSNNPNPQQVLTAVYTNCDL